MIRIRPGRPLGIAVMLGSLAACVGDPAPPPVTSLGDRACSDQPFLGDAKPVVLDRDKSVTVKLDGTAPCWQAADGAKSIYSAFALPQNGEPVLLSVTSDPIGVGLFAPRVLLLDETDRVVRELPRDSFMFHGSSLYLGIRLHPGERYLVVASDTGSVGRQFDHTVETTRVTEGSAVSASGGVFFSIHTGADSTTTYTYSYNGTVTVTAQPMPKGN